MAMTDQKAQKITLLVFGWSLLALTAAGWVLMGVSGMLDHVVGVSERYSGMDKAADGMTGIVLFFPLLPLWIVGIRLLEKGSQQDSLFSRTVFGVGIAGMVAMLLVAVRLMSLG